MNYKVSIIKHGKELASEIVQAPSEGEITAAIGRVSDEARKKNGGPLSPYLVDVRHA